MVFPAGIMLQKEDGSSTSVYISLWKIINGVIKRNDKLNSTKKKEKTDKFEGDQKEKKMFT